MLSAKLFNFTLNNIVNNSLYTILNHKNYKNVINLKLLKNS